MVSQMREEISLKFSPSEAEHIANLAQVIRSGGLRKPEERLAWGLSGDLQSGRGKVFMHPAAARVFAQSIGEKRAQEFVGARARREWRDGHLFSQPTLTSVHVDAPLTQMSIAYRNASYIAAEVFPRVQVTKESGKYFTFGKGPWLRDEARMRAPGAVFQRGGYTVSTESYSVDEWGYEHPIDERVRNNADSPLNLDRSGTNFVSDKIDLKLERDVAALAFTGGSWTNTTAPTAWDNDAGAPFTDFKTARLTVMKESTRPPNVIVFGVEAFEVLALHTDLLDRIKYTGTSDRPAMVTPNMMAALFGVDQVLIGMGVYDTSVEPAASVETFIWGKNVLVMYRSPSPALEDPSAGYVFTTGRLVDRYYEPQTTSDVIRAREAFDSKVTSPDSGYLMTAVVA